MNAYTVIFDGLPHLGPGDTETTRELVERLRPALPTTPRIADFGCGAGASTLVLADCLPGSRILALDLHAPFVERLRSTARGLGLDDAVSAVVGDMAQPPRLDGVTGEFDLIWSESAIYNIGRARAYTAWRPLLKPGGWLVFSDIVWQPEPGARSKEAAEFWSMEYPAMTTVAGVVNELDDAGFAPLDPVLADRRAWSNYYEPLRERLRRLSGQEDSSPALKTVIAELEHETGIYDSAGGEVAIAFFIARRSGPGV